MKKIRLGGELLHRTTPVSCITVCLIVLVLPRCGGESWETVCEFQDANLLFPNTPVGSAGDIKAKTWNKENGIRVASWMETTNFEPNKLYGDRLMAIGENSIKIRNATRSDSGTYTLVLTSGSTQKFLEYTLHVEVLVPPTNQCIPSITQESNALMPKLPPDLCGIPMVTSKWKNVPDNISVLYFESGLVPGIYTVCANGKSIHCFKGDVNTLCSNHTVSEIQPQSSSNWIIAAITVPVILIVMIVAIVLVCSKKRYKRRNLRAYLSLMIQKRTADEEISSQATAEAQDILYKPNEKDPLVDEETSPKGVQAIKRHLINQYRSMTALSLSPCYEENLVDVSAVYCDLDIISLGEDVEEMLVLKTFQRSLQF